MNNSLLLQHQCWDSDTLVTCPKITLEGQNSTIRMENITRAIPSTTELRKDPLYSQVISFFYHHMVLLYESDEFNKFKDFDSKLRIIKSSQCKMLSLQVVAIKIFCEALIFKYLRLVYVIYFKYIHVNVGSLLSQMHFIAVLI